MTTRAEIPVYKMFINGEWVESQGGNTIGVENPANEEIIAYIQNGTAEDAIRALKAAKAAQKAWAKLPGVERGKILSKFASLILENKEKLAEILVKEQGKLYNTALGEVEVSADFIQFAAEFGRRIRGDIFPSDFVDEEVYIKREPHGVVAGITAWNFPLALACRKIGPALITGNTIVVKPPLETPVATLELGNLALQAGIPNGVLNIITGDGIPVGQTLVEHPLTDLVTMTGSTKTGQQIFRTAADRLTPVRLELGGKAPFIVLEDADLDKAVEAAIFSRFFNCGQVCTCNERMYIHQKVYDAFMQKFLERVKALEMGDPFRQDVDLGPKVSRAEVDKLANMVDNAVQSGAKVILGGQRPKEKPFDKGFWYAPTVLEVEDNKLEIMQKEIFGPVVPVMQVKSAEQAVELANDSNYGLSAFVFSNDLKTTMYVVNSLDFGEVYVNRQMGELRQGFHNGFKLSGIGGEDGIYGLENYLRKKTVYLNFSE